MQGFSSLPSWPYQPGDGYWSPVTSTLNWCEEDYYATHYVAEIVNTVTNLSFVFLGFKGIANCIQNGHPNVYLAAFVVYTAIGIGSTLFHGMLTYPMQLVDELAMIYFTSVLFYGQYSHGLSKFNANLLLVFVIGLSAVITGYYHYIKNPVFHETAFALMESAVVLRGIYVMEQLLRPSRRARAQGGSKSRAGSAAQAETDKRDLAILRNLWGLTGLGLIYIGVAFFIWNLDNIFCSTIRRWRREMGLPWGIVLEGHGYWHILTGLAAYYQVVSGLYLRYCLDGKQDEVVLHWPRLLTSIPWLERRSKSKKT